jgi:hypothetical protein
VDFAFLAKTAPEPLKSEWSGGKGINVHHKFVVTDFSLATAKVFTGSSNLERREEQRRPLDRDRGPEDRHRIRHRGAAVFDHLHFRSRMKAATSGKKK